MEQNADLQLWQCLSRARKMERDHPSCAFAPDTIYTLDRKKKTSTVKKIKKEEPWQTFDGKPQSNSANNSGINLLANFDHNKLSCVELITFFFSTEQLILSGFGWRAFWRVLQMHSFEIYICKDLQHEGKHHQTDETRRSRRQRLKVSGVASRQSDTKRYVTPKRSFDWQTPEVFNEIKEESWRYRQGSLDRPNTFSKKDLHSL